VLLQALAAPLAAAAADVSALIPQLRSPEKDPAGEQLLALKAAYGAHATHDSLMGEQSHIFRLSALNIERLLAAAQSMQLRCWTSHLVTHVRCAAGQQHTAPWNVCV
jgi:hypothetical protein